MGFCPLSSVFLPLCHPARLPVGVDGMGFCRFVQAKGIGFISSQTSRHVP